MQTKLKLAKFTVIMTLFFTISFIFIRESWAFPSFYPKDTPEFNFQVDLSGWSSYVTQLKSCRPSKWTLPSPIQIDMIKQMVRMSGGRNAQGNFYTQSDIDLFIKNAYQVYTIKGWEKGQCSISMDILPDDSISKMLGVLSNLDLSKFQSITKIECHFAKKDIPIIAEMTKKMVKENVIDFVLDGKEMEILMKSCQMH